MAGADDSKKDEGALNQSSGSVLYDASPSMFRNRPIGFILSVALIVAYGIGIIILLIWYLNSVGTRLTITKQKTILTEGLLSKTRTELKNENIRSISVSQSFFQRIFDVGSIEIFTAGDRPEIVVRGLRYPEKIRSLIG